MYLNVFSKRLNSVAHSCQHGHLTRCSAMMLFLKHSHAKRLKQKETIFLCLIQALGISELGMKKTQLL